MFTLHRLLLAALTVLATVTLADVIATFNVGSWYEVEQVRRGPSHKIALPQSQQFQIRLKSEKTLDRVVENLGAWSIGEFTCTRGTNGAPYEIFATHNFRNLNDARNGNQRAMATVNNHRNDE
ncbi:hypothetical protein E4U21_007746 [Claviceps maximensis]|nr:hypothetical protein E4U21_007746 [Claviceps maximensis]